MVQELMLSEDVLEEFWIFDLFFASCVFDRDWLVFKIEWLTEIL